MTPVLTSLLLRVRAKQAGPNRWYGQCPAHDDDRASLSISLGDKAGVLLKCHAGCTFEDISSKLKDVMPQSAPIAPSKEVLVATYDYRDESGALLYQVLRYSPKAFRQRKGDGSWVLTGVRRVPYRLPELRAGCDKGRVVFFVEGEKDVHTLTEMGLTATCLAGGADAPLPPDFSQHFAGAHKVICIPDNDAPGRKLMERACAALGATGAIVSLPGLREKQDVSDWVNDPANTPKVLKRLVEAAVEAPPAPALPPRTQERMAQASSAIHLVKTAGERAIVMPLRNVAALTGRLLRGTVWYVIAFSGRGKTSFTLSVCELWTQMGLKVWYMGLESRPESLRTQWACRALKIDPERVTTGLASDDEVRRVLMLLEAQRDAPEGSPAANLHFSPTDHISADAIKAEAAQAASEGYDVFVIDHIDHDEGGGGPAESVRVNQALQDVSKVYPSMLYFATSQANNESLRGDRMGSFMPVQPNHVWYPGKKRMVATGQLGLYKPLRVPLPEEAEQFVKDLKAVRAGLLDEKTVLTKSTMGVNLMKHRDAGHREGDKGLLHIAYGAVRDWTSMDDAMQTINQRREA